MMKTFEDTMSYSSPCACTLAEYRESLENDCYSTSQVDVLIAACDSLAVNESVYVDSNDCSLVTREDFEREQLLLDDVNSTVDETVNRITRVS